MSLYYKHEILRAIYSLYSTYILNNQRKSKTFPQATILQPAYTTRATKMIPAPKTADTPAKMIAPS